MAGCVCGGGDLTEHLKVLGVPTPLRLGKQGRRTRHVGDVRDNQAALPSLERAADPVAAAFRHEHEDRRESLPTGPGTSGWHRRRLDAERGRPRCPPAGSQGTAAAWAERPPSCPGTVRAFPSLAIVMG